MQIHIILGIVVVILMLKMILTGSNVKKKKLSLPSLGWKLFYSDQKEASRRDGVIYSKLLRSARHGLQGKPDYIYKSVTGRAMIPVELKSGKIGELESPRQGDLMQLVAYFLIIEDEYGIRPKYGLLLYRDYMFQVRNDRRIRRVLLDTLADMREMLETGEGEANAGYAVCRHCICRETVCEFEP